MARALGDPRADLVSARGNYRGARRQTEVLLARLVATCGGDPTSAESGSAERLVAELASPDSRARADELHILTTYADAVSTWPKGEAVERARGVLDTVPATTSRAALMRLRTIMAGAFARLGLDTDRAALDLLTSLDKRTAQPQVAELARLVSAGGDLARETFRTLRAEDATLASVARVLAERDDGRAIMQRTGG